jgi:hypothetical protein
MTPEFKEKELANLTKLMKKVTDKAELVIKLAIPREWDKGEIANNQIIYLTPPTLNDDLDEDIGGNADLVTRLKTAKDRQTAQAAVNDLADIKHSKEILNTSITAILACLQCNISSSQIWVEIEKQYINAIKRFAGLKIMQNVAKCNMNDETMISCFNWF